MAVKSTNYQVGLSNTNSQNFNIRTGLDGTLRIYRGSDTLELNEVFRIDNSGNLTAKGMLGVSQTWQNLTASRALGVTYTNTSASPIEVSVSITNGTSGQNVSIFVSDVPVSFLTQLTNVYGSSTTFTVPAGATYKAIPSGGSPFIATWSELK